MKVGTAPLIPPGRDWQGAEGASAAALQALRDAAPTPLPERYFELLEQTNGGEGVLPVQPLNFCLYSAEEAAQCAREGTFRDHFPGLFAFAGNGAGEVIAFDLRQDPAGPIVYFDVCNSDLEESVVPLAESFDDLVEMIGLWDN
jgi:hypothetical protein